jgi:hypothetical protein
MSKQNVSYWQDGDAIFSVIYEKISWNQWAKVCGSEKLIRKCQNKDEAAKELTKVRKAQAEAAILRGGEL